MKKLICILIVTANVFTVISQKKFNVLVLNVDYVKAPISEYESFKDQVVMKSDTNGGFFLAYHIDLSANTVKTSMDEGSVFELYKIISVKRVKRHLCLTVTSNNTTSFIDFDKKGKRVTDLTHYEVGYELITGTRGTSLVDL